MVTAAICGVGGAEENPKRRRTPDADVKVQARGGYDEPVRGHIGMTGPTSTRSKL